MYKIGHAIGFWHEQSRPDRDQYVIILLSNVVRGQASRKKLKFTHLGSTYDYMDRSCTTVEQPLNTFKKPDCSGSGCTTISVNNQAEYN